MVRRVVEVASVTVDAEDEETTDMFVTMIEVTVEVRWEEPSGTVFTYLGAIPAHGALDEESHRQHSQVRCTNKRPDRNLRRRLCIGGEAWPTFDLTSSALARLRFCSG